MNKLILPFFTLYKSMKNSFFIIATLLATVTATSQTSIDRTYKKIEPIAKFNEPWTIQLLTMKRQPKEATFFEELDDAYEIISTDGWIRYYVGQYKTEEEANEMLKLIQRKNEKYKDAFVVRTQSVNIDKNAFGDVFCDAKVNKSELKADSLIEMRHKRDSISAEKAKKAFHFAAETQNNDPIIEAPYQGASSFAEEKKIYAVQILAARYPIYKKEIVEFDDIEEFYMPDDQIFRYTTKSTTDKEKAKADVQKALDAGYTEATIIDYSVYKKFRVD